MVDGENSTESFSIFSKSCLISRSRLNEVHNKDEFFLSVFIEDFSQCQITRVPYLAGSANSRPDVCPQRRVIKKARIWSARPNGSGASSTPDSVHPETGPSELGREAGIYLSPSPHYPQAISDNVYRKNYACGYGDR